MFSNHDLMQLFTEAGPRPGVIDFLPGSGGTVAEPVIADPRFGDVHFTGTTGVFNGIWSTVGENIANYGQYPRLVGETGGKDFILAHRSGDAQAPAVALVRGAFEYQGQECAAASRAYVPKSMWNDVRERTAAMLAEMKMGDVRDFENFAGARIDARSCAKLKGAIDAARASKSAKVVLGGECDDAMGWFVQPTVIEATNPRYDTMCTERFGPVLTLHVYDDARWSETLGLVDATSEDALTGAVFANDHAVVREATDRLRFAAGNFYVNDSRQAPSSARSPSAARARRAPMTRPARPRT